MMNILIAFEASGNTRRAFAAAGHNVFSCDLQPARDGETEKHIQMDAFTVLRGVKQLTGADCWDLVIAHPPCTAVAVSGNAHYAAGKPGYGDRLASIQMIGQFWIQMWDYSKRGCIENPVGVLATRSCLGKASQIVQPYQFGHDASKATCLWLYGLPHLKETENLLKRVKEFLS